MGTVPTSLGVAPNGKLYVRLDDIQNTSNNRIVSYTAQSYTPSQSIAQPSYATGPTFMAFSPSVTYAVSSKDQNLSITHQGDWIKLSKSVGDWSDRLLIQASDQLTGIGTARTTVTTLDISTNSSSTIRGNVYNDTNRDDNRDQGESGVEGMVIYVDSDNDGQLDTTEISTLTDWQGNYQFTGVVGVASQPLVIRPLLATPSSWQFNQGSLTISTPQAIFEGLDIGLARMVQIGPDQRQAEGTALSFNGVIQSVGVGVALDYRWEVRKNNVLVASTPTASDVGPINTNFDFTPNDNGVYAVSLLVSLTGSNQSTALYQDSTQITVSNVAPQAVSIQGLPLDPIEGQQIVLSASFFELASGDQIAYSWTILRDGLPLAGVALDQATLTFTPNDQANYVVGLTVRDDDGGVGIASDIEFQVSNVAPQVSISGAPTQPTEGAAISLTGEVTDPDILYTDRSSQFSYQWTAIRNGLPYSLANSNTVELEFVPEDEGTYVLSFVATDNNGATSSPASVVLEVGNVSPVATIVGAPASLQEGQPLLLTSSVSDAGIYDSVATYQWTVTRGGQQYLTASGPSLGFVPGDNGVYSISLVTTDNSGSVSSADQASIAVSNVLPTIQRLDNWVGQIDERTSLPLLAVANDPGSEDVLTYTWTITRNGDPFASSTQTSPDYLFAPTDDGTYEIVVQVRDDDQPTGSDASLTRTVQVFNSAPTASLVVPSSQIFEGSSISLGLTSVVDSSADLAAGFTYSYDLDGDGTYEIDNVTQATQLIALPESGLRSLGFKVKDKNGAESTYRTTLSVQNVAPSVISLQLPSNEDQGAPVQILGTYSDPGEDVHVGVATIQRVGDSEIITSPVRIMPGGNFELDHIFTEVGMHSVTITIDDAELGAPVSMSANIQINNVAPILDLGSQGSVKAGREFQRSLGFIDPGTDPWHVTVDYNTADGIPGVPMTFDPATHTIDFRHTYSTAGVFQVSVSVFDGVATTAGTFQVDVSANSVPVSQLSLPTFVVNQGYSQTSSFANLREYFADADGTAAELQFSVTSNSNAALVTPRLQDGYLGFAFDTGVTGSSLLTIRATDIAGDFVEQIMTVTVLSRDTTSPVSSVDSLPTRATSLSVPIRVTGSDPIGPANSQVSGVREYDLYVAEGAGSFQKFATVPAANPVTMFQAQSNKTYFFRSVARDAVGNVEVKPVVAESQITVGDFDPPATQVTSAVANQFGLFTVGLTGTESGGGQLQYIDLYVSIDDGTAELVGSVTAGAPNSSGIYQASATYQGRTDGLSHKYRFFSVGRDSNGNIETAPGLLNDVVVTSTFATSSLVSTGIDVQLGAQQRSYIRYVDVLFNSEAGLSDLLLLNPIKVERFALDAATVTPGTGTDVTGFTANKVGDRLRLDWGINGITGSRNTNAGDGFYRIRIDGNGDGDYADAVDQVFEFARILGDANGDYSVTTADRDVVDAQLGRTGTNLNGDVDGSGTVNSTDRTRVNNQIAINRKLADHLKPLVDD